MKIIKKQNELIDLVRSDHSIIGIDGIDGVGKSTIAEMISTKYGHTHLNLDDYLEKKKGGYFDYLNLEKIKDDIKKSQKNIIEGVILQKVLNKLQIKPDYIIYVADSVLLSDWSREFDGKYSKMSLDEVIKDAECLTNKISQAINSHSNQYKMRGFHLELYRYMHHYKPWEMANIIFEKH